MRKNIILWILEIALGVLGSIAVFWGYSSMNIFTLYAEYFFGIQRYHNCC